MLERGDKKRADYYNYYTDRSWGAATTYDLCLNTSVLGIEGTAKLIEDYLDRLFGDEAK